MVFPTECSKGVCISKKLSKRNVVWFVGLNRGFLCRLLVDTAPSNFRDIL